MRKLQRGEIELKINVERLAQYAYNAKAAIKKAVPDYVQAEKWITKMCNEIDWAVLDDIHERDLDN